MARPKVNFAVDVASFLAFVLLTATGVLMRYVLPPGSGHHTTLVGLDRHQWGEIHFLISAIFLALLASHVALHWRWIVCVLRGRPREGADVRVALGVVGLLAVLAVVAAPLIVPVERLQDTPGVAGRRGSGHATIRGSMTLAEVERATGISAARLAAKVGLPADVAHDVPLTQLAAKYGLRMGALRRAAAELQPETH